MLAETFILRIKARLRVALTPSVVRIEPRFVRSTIAPLAREPAGRVEWVPSQPSKANGQSGMTSFEAASRFSSLFFV